MKKNDLKHLSRKELLELLLVQTKEMENLQKRLEVAEAELSDRHIKVEKAGNLAQAVININEVMQAAQEAADQYLENIKRMERDAKLHCEQLIKDAKMEAVEIKRKAFIEMES